MKIVNGEMIDEGETEAFVKKCMSNWFKHHYPQLSEAALVTNANVAEEVMQAEENTPTGRNHVATLLTLLTGLENGDVGAAKTRATSFGRYASQVVGAVIGMGSDIFEPSDVGSAEQFVMDEYLAKEKKKTKKLH